MRGMTWRGIFACPSVEELDAARLEVDQKEQLLAGSRKMSSSQQQSILRLEGELEDVATSMNSALERSEAGPGECCPPRHLTCFVFSAVFTKLRHRSSGIATRSTNRKSCRPTRQNPTWPRSLS